MPQLKKIDADENSALSDERFRNLWRAVATLEGFARCNARVWVFSSSQLESKTVLPNLIAMFFLQVKKRKLQTNVYTGWATKNGPFVTVCNSWHRKAIHRPVSKCSVLCLE